MFSEKSIHNFSHSDYPSNHRRSKSQKSRGNTIVDFFKAFVSIHKGKMEEIQQAYGLPKETVTVIMMFYKNAKEILHSPDGDSDFDITAGVFQEVTLAL